VVVFDTGKGIKADEIKTLFTRFGKLERTANLNSDGIGLGLVISKRLVEANGGSIEIQSEGENMGSTFRFHMKMRLPLPSDEIREVQNCGFEQFANHPSRSDSVSMSLNNQLMHVASVSTFKAN
jgi:hypothetical protein